MMENCPLTGQPCPHKKHIHITDCGPNYTLESFKNMCVLCGSQYLDAKNQPLPFSGIFTLFKHLVQKPQACPTCGITLTEINKAGKLGCGDCYLFFKDALNQLLYKLHGSTKHTGKGISNKLHDLENQLADAIQAEDYEKAAKLRDEINELNK